MSFGKNDKIISSNSVNCWECTHFGITHEKNFPYKCGAMNFKSKSLPSNLVIEVEGNRCLSFNRK